MKTIFIINPAAGLPKNKKTLTERIRKAIASSRCDAEMYVTKSVGDAREFVREYCLKSGPARFIACGGDGTLSEVLNGAADFEEAEIGVIPYGTGNDFCRNFGIGCDFTDIMCQMSGNVVTCDAIRYTTYINDSVRQGYCVNMFNIGFDCNVADMTANMKKNPFVSGSFAYFISIFFTLIKKKGADLKIELDGKVAHCGKLLLTSLANGCYCGGGIMSNPMASVTDGMINTNIIKNVSRLKFISLLPYYMKGALHRVRDIGRFVTTKKCRKIVITPNNGKMRLCIDGEIIDAGKTEFEIVPGAFRFVLPKKCAKETVCI
jgi:YegS/Rv2252/BmrU family lipid kinase